MKKQTRTKAVREKILSCSYLHDKRNSVYYQTDSCVVTKRGEKNMNNDKKYYLPEKSVEATAKNFHVRYADGNCNEWTVIINGKLTGDIYHTNNHLCGLWKNDKQIIGTCDADFSESTNYRRKQIRALMLKMYCEVE